MGIVSSVLSPLQPVVSIVIPQLPVTTSVVIPTTTKLSSTSTIKTTSSSSSVRTSSTLSSIIVTTSTVKSTSSSSSSTIKSSSSSSSSTSKSSSSSSSSTSSSTSSSASPTSTGPVSVGAKILILAKSDSDASNSYSGLQGYGIPYEVLVVPQTGVTFPTLNSSETQGNYGGFVVHSGIAYEYTSGWASALTTAQWQQLYDYQTAFNVRMVQIDVYPTSDFGATVVGSGCCDTGVEQLISFTNLTAFPGSGLRQGATVSSQGVWHYPASITDPTTTWEIAKFGPGGSITTDTTAAVINKFPNGQGSRQQMAFFTGFATAWSTGSNFMMHSWIYYMTRGLYVGNRRIHFSTQIDDVELGTFLYEPTGAYFRTRPADMAAHVTWMSTMNTRMNKNNPGSNYFIELGHNGNGNIENATLGDTLSVCSPSTNINTGQPAYNGTLEWMKPLGTGTSYWPTTPASYPWDLKCSLNDPLLTWIVNSANLDSYAHVSHTFTHLNFNNATGSDANKEISWNQAWFKTTGIDKAAKFSSNGLIPPAITGMHNGDVIQAWLENGIKYVVGDNTRPVLKNSQNSFWPLTTTVADNGYAGVEIIPRFATSIYFNCDLPACTTDEWINTSGGSGDFQNLLTDARNVSPRNLLGLHQDPYMFHQANMRYADVASLTIDGVTGQYSLLMAWTETVVNEFIRLVDWPMITLKHDDIAKKFIARRTRDQCNPQLTWKYSSDRKTITGVTVSATGNTCGTPIPVAFPGPVTSTQGHTTEQLGNDPLTVWVTLSGSPVTFTLATPVSVTA